MEREQRKQSKSPAKGAAFTGLSMLSMQGAPGTSRTRNLQEQANKIDAFEKEWSDFKSKTTTKLTFSELLDVSGVSQTHHAHRLSNYNSAHPTSKLQGIVGAHETDAGTGLRVRSSS